LTLEQRSVAASILWSLKGDAGQRALTAWHMGWEPARAASGDAGWFAPYLAAMLDDPYATVRYIAGRSLKRQPGFENLSYDYVTDADSLRHAREAALAEWQSHTKLQENPCLLMQADGQLESSKVASLQAERNNRSMDLNE
jgi:hypothetical protein